MGLVRGPILITGATGYLGGAITQALHAQGVALRLGFRQGIPEAIRHCGEWIPLDMTRLADIERATDGAGAVIHLAALDEEQCVDDPAQAIAVNIGGTLSLARAAQKAACRRFIFMSTAHVYGPLNGTISEETPTLARHPYAYTHRASEDVLRSFCAPGAMEGVTLRLSNCFGCPTDPFLKRWTLLGNDLCRQAASTRQLVLKSAGHQLRDFIPKADLCAAVTHVLSEHFPTHFGTAFNLGGDLTLSVYAMAERIAERSAVVLGFKPPILRQAASAAASTAQFRYSSAALKATGYAPRAKVDDEIDATLRFSSQHFSRDGV